jgi:hypothetical protein
LKTNIKTISSSQSFIASVKKFGLGDEVIEVWGFPMCDVKEVCQKHNGAEGPYATRLHGGLRELAQLWRIGPAAIRRPIANIPEPQAADPETILLLRIHVSTTF